MRHNHKRLTALEQSCGLGGGWDYTRPAHAIIVDGGQPYGDALAEYQKRNPGKLVSAKDNVIWRRIVTPKFGPDGGMIPNSPACDKTGPSLADVMNGAVQ